MENSIVKDMHEGLQRYVGGKERVPLGVVRAKDFQRFAVASGDPNPIFFDDEVARRHGKPGVLAPPLYLSSVMGWGVGPPEESLRPDGSAGDDAASLPLEGLRLMGAGQDLEFFEPVTDGAEVVMERIVEAVDLKEGKSGALILVRLTKRYLGADDRLLLVCRETFIGR